MEDQTLIDVASSCVHALMALVMIAVGAIVVRADKKSGFMTIAVGALLFLTGCCTSLPMLMLRTGAGMGSIDTVWELAVWGKLLLMIASGALVVVASIVLARKVIERGEP